MLVVAVCSTSAYGMSPMLRELENEYVRIGDIIRPFVVDINVEGPASDLPRVNDMQDLEQFFRERLFGTPGPEGRPQPQPRRRPMEASGSGFIYSKQGHIVTNNHVVEQAERITVTLWDGEQFDAEVVGLDPQTDLAVIKIDAGRDLQEAIIADSDLIRVGQFAIAMGSARGLEGSMSFGHVTALGREGLELPQQLRFQRFIQTDAAINLGNSGGPLCNIDGEVVGINTAIVFGADALGFAIPVNTARRVIPALIQNGRVTRGFLGVQIKNAKIYKDADTIDLPDDKGALVEYVWPDSPADRAGLLPYDVVRKVNGKEVDKATDLMILISELPPGTVAALEIWREGKAMEVRANLDEFDEQVAAEVIPEQDALGLTVRDFEPEMAQQLGMEEGTKGVLVTEVEAGSAAEDAGILPGHVILDVAMKPVETAEEYRTVMREHAKPGKTLLLKTVRGADKPSIKAIKVPLMETPDIGEEQ
jgi:serine protease Do